MADFAAILRKNIEKLGETTPEIRAKVYEKARDALQRKLDAMDPAPPQAAIDRQFVKMDAAVEEIEAEFAPLPVDDPLDDIESLLSPDEVVEADEALPVDAEPEATVQSEPEPTPEPEVAAEPQAEVAEEVNAVVPEAPVEADASAVEPVMLDAPTEPVSTDEQDDDPLRTFLEENAERFAAEEPPVIGAAATADTASDVVVDEPSVSPALDATEAVSVEADEAVAPAAQKPAPAWGRLAGFGVLALLVAGVIYVATTNPQVRALVGLEQTTSDENGLPVRTVETTTVTDTDAGTATDTGTLEGDDVAITVQGDNAETVVIGTGQEVQPKFTQRLTEDGREVDDGPADGAPAQGEGTSVSDQTPGTEGDDTVTTADAGAEDQTEATETPLRVGQRAIFYEERTGTEAGTAVPGSIIWTQVQESPGGDLPLEPAIRGQASVPDLDLSMIMTIRRNGDATFPASHIIELFFTVPDTFTGRGIGDVQRVTLKGTEQDPGTALIGVPAPLDTNIFLIALTDAGAAVQSNTQLLRSENWIDIPMQYVSGRRALVTLEKGIPGERIFQEVFDFWDANPLPGQG